MIKYLALGFLVFLSLSSSFVGSVDVDFKEIFVSGSLSSNVFFNLRVPRFILAFFMGVLLALSGWLYQGLFRNSLMTPFTLGISGGAVLGVGISVVLGLEFAFFGLSVSALFGFVGAMSSVLLLLYFSRFVKDSTGNSLLLLGIALSFFFSASLMVLFSISTATQSYSILRYTMGDLSTIGYNEAIVVTLSSLLLLAFLYLKRYELAMLSVSEQNAKLKGLDTKKITLLLLVVSSFVIGVAISITGPIGFVGLIIPHMAKKLFKLPSYKLIVPTALLGGLFLSACDTLSRLWIFESEIPIGVVTAFIGGPFFIYLILKRV